jgi:hypothetical protein
MGLLKLLNKFMLKESKINSLESHEQGENIRIDLVIRRHSKYDKKTGSLTAEGLALAKEVGQKTKPLSEDDNFVIKSVSSDLPRAKETAAEILKNINTRHKDLGVGRTEHLDTNIYLKNLTSFLEDGSEKLADGRIITTKAFAADKAKDIYYVMEMSKKLPKDFKLQIINVTHLPWLLAFLKEAAGAQLSLINPAGKNFIEKMGGEITFNEGFELKIYRKSQDDDCQISLNFRGQEISISEKKIKELIKAR